MVVGYRTVGVSVEGHDGVYKVPDDLVVSMEDVGSIFMDVNAFNILAIDIAAQVGTLVYDKAIFALLFGLMGEGCAEEARAYN